MGLFDRLGRVIQANLNDLVGKAEDPEKILEQTILEMQENLIQLRQGVAQAIAVQKRTEQQYNQAEANVQDWLRKAQLAMQKGDENLARQALERKKAFAEQAATLKPSLDQQIAQVNTLKSNLQTLEAKIVEAKTKKDTLKARVVAAQAQEQIGNMVGGISANSGSAVAAFERMEEKVLMMEARVQGVNELGGADLDAQFKALESGSDVDDELAALRAQTLAPAPQPIAALPSSPQPQSTPKTVSSPGVESELEQLRRELNQM